MRNCACTTATFAILNKKAKYRDELIPAQCLVASHANRSAHRNRLASIKSVNYDVEEASYYSTEEKNENKNKNIHETIIPWLYKTKNHSSEWFFETV